MAKHENHDFATAQSILDLAPICVRVARSHALLDRVQTASLYSGHPYFSTCAIVMRWTEPASKINAGISVKVTHSAPPADELAPASWLADSGLPLLSAQRKK